VIAALVAWLAVAILFTAAARADLQVQHDSYVATEAGGDADGIIGPGDPFTLTEKLHSANPNGTLTQVNGTLQTAAQGVSVTQATSPYPDLYFNATSPSSNTTAFQALLASSVDCGVNVPFALQLTANQNGQPAGSQSLSFTVQTGAAGAFKSYTSTQVPLSIPDVGYAISSFTVPSAGRVRGVRVQIGSLTHTYDGDLRIELISPDGTDVHLIEPNNNNTGANFTNTVFDDAAPTTITSATAPYTGSFKPVQFLSNFIGVQQQGTWQLKITDVSPGNTGTLNGWGSSVKPAVCTTTPIASFTATPNPATPNTSVSFDGTGSVEPNPNATITGYAWNFGDGSTGSGSATTHPYALRGSYTVTLTVTDNASPTPKSATTTLPVTVGQAPVAAIQATPSSPVSGQQVTFDASGSTHDPAGSIANYSWDLDGSGNFATNTGTTAQVTTSFPSKGPVAVSVRVTDDLGATATATTKVTVANAPPVASFTASAPAVTGQPVAFDGTSSRDIDDAIVDYKWDLDGSGRYATDTGSTPSASFTYSSAATVTVGLRVTDTDGATNQTTRTIQVVRPPVAALTATPAIPTSGQLVTLDASGSSDPAGTIVAYSFDLDGSGRYATSTGASPVLRQAFTAGTYHLGVRVTDSFGATAVAPLTLVVTSPGGAGTTGTGPTSLLALLGPTIGGDPAAGIAGLTGGDLQAIVRGSDNHFAAIGGAVVRRAGAVAKHGLWLNLLADRPASFSLTVSIAAADAKRLHISRSQRTKALQKLISVATRLRSAGQRPYNVVLPAGARSKLGKLRGRVQLVVTGAADDGHGHRTALSRTFEVKR
jgi:subtilisin-like proprotein convertase family protein